MRKIIQKILAETPGIKAKEIAKKLSVDKAEVNSFLYDHLNLFAVDEKYRWSLKASELRIELPIGWVNCRQFETALAKSASPLDADVQSIIFFVPDGCSLLLEVIARLMALSNQLVYNGKKVTIDFAHEATSTFTYLDRLGFFEHLSAEVIVVPERPKTSAAEVFKGNSDNLVEIGIIDPVDPDENIPIQLKESFVSHAGTKYALPAFTVLSELFGNVRDHSESHIPGFVALQYYGKGRYPHIQTVISDSGKGIIGTLKPILAIKYPDVAEEIASSRMPFEKALLNRVFTKGEISRSEDKGHGLGLKRSGDVASKFDATIMVRQEKCEAKFIFRQGLLFDYQFWSDMPRILGTHICFDFSLDR